MSDDAEACAAKLIQLTERLTTALAADAKSLEARRPHEAGERMAETAALANLYRHESARMKQTPALLAGAAKATMARLTLATEAFNAVLARHARALHGAKVVTEGLVRAMAEEVARQRGEGSSYGANALTQAGSATAVALNRRA